MEEILYALGGIFTVYLYADRFVFGGKLWPMFLDGWRQILGIRSRKKTEAEGDPSGSTMQPTDTSPDALLDFKRYYQRQRMPVGDNDPKTAPNATEKHNFTAGKEQNTEPETMEYRSAEFQNKDTGIPVGQRWEDQSFAATEDGSDVDIVDPEEINKEVIEKMNTIILPDEEEEDVLTPTEEEMYGLGHFDAGAYY